MYGFDVYSSEVADRGIDFVIRRKPDSYYDIQVKSVRGLNYIFFPKEKFPLRSNLIAAIVLFTENETPKIFLIPSFEWKFPNTLLVDHEYTAKKSKPEWGLNLSLKNISILEKYNFEDHVVEL